VVDAVGQDRRALGGVDVAEAGVLGLGGPGPRGGLGALLAGLAGGDLGGRGGRLVLAHRAGVDGGDGRAG
jgi:hypothetical protein